ncbi:exo-alpha-sialidase [Termitidicoccus mucosus]|uniref:sialidase family protein n=1 Tax=Termitidicoccus mucosus TaxID=1184151 RepID=UPI000A01A9F4
MPRYILFIPSLLLSCCLALASAVAHPAVLRSGFIYETAPYPECHASTIVETSPGKLVAAWFGGTKEKNPDVCIWVSHFENDKWAEAKNVADGLQPDGKRHPTWNPVLFQPPGKGAPLILFYKVGPSPTTWWGMQIKSTDGGHTWSAPERLPDGILGPIKNKPVVLTDGSWLSPSSTESRKDGWQVHFECSRDAGKTWTVIGPVRKGPNFDAIQPSVLFFPGGRLEALCRTRQGVIAMTWSEDRGRTWSPLAATGLPNPNSGTDAVTLRDGRQLLIYNHSAHRPDRPGKGWRYPIGLALSDDGIQWRRSVTLDDAPLPEGYAYPAIIQTADGLVHATYTWDRKRIRHVVINPSLL